MTPLSVRNEEHEQSIKREFFQQREGQMMTQRYDGSVKAGDPVGRLMTQQERDKHFLPDGSFRTAQAFNPPQGDDKIVSDLTRMVLRLRASVEQVARLRERLGLGPIQIDPTDEMIGPPPGIVWVQVELSRGLDELGVLLDSLDILA